MRAKLFWILFLWCRFFLFYFILFCYDHFYLYYYTIILLLFILIIIHVILTITSLLSSSTFFLLPLLLLLLSLLLLSYVLSPKSQSIKASPQSRRYFNPGSHAVLRHILSDWARAQRSTVGRSRSISSPLSLPCASVSIGS